MDNFEQLKEICRQACHERSACEHGFKALMNTETIPQIMQVWKDNWDDVFRSRYSDIMVHRLTELNPSAVEEMRKGGVYVNEDRDDGYVIVSNPDRTINVGGTARAYLFTAAEVTATDNAQVYCRTSGVKVTLRGHAYCHSEARDAVVTVYNFAHAEGKMQCTTYNAAEVVIQGGTLIDHGHRRIAAYGGTRVYSDATKGIEIGGQARKYPVVAMESQHTGQDEGDQTGQGDNNNDNIL